MRRKNSHWPYFPITWDRRLALMSEKLSARLARRLSDRLWSTDVIPF